MSWDLVPLPLDVILQVVATVVLVPWTWFAFGYTIIIQVCMLLFVMLSSGLLNRPRAAVRSGRAAEVMGSAIPVGVSAVMPAYNESAGIIDGVRAMLQMSYPLFEVIVVNDGSSDNTMDLLVEEFDLYPIEMGPVPFPELTTNPVRGVYVPTDTSIPLRVVDKTPGGNKAFAVNVGVAAAVHPWVVVVDSDSLVDPDAVTYAIAEVTTSAVPVLGVGGTVLPSNDAIVEDGLLKEARVPRSFVAACQLAEYLRSFVVGRAAFGSIGSVAIISGAFGVFRRSDVLAVGGYSPGHLGEDLDLAVRLQRRASQENLNTGLVHVPECLLWTEVPETLGVLSRQRTRWHRGLKQTMRDHKVTIGNRRFGRFGSFGMTYLWLFEYFAPLIEGLGYVALALSLLLGALNWQAAALILVLTLLAGFTNTVQAIWLEQRHFRLYSRPSDLARLLLVAVGEQLGYRQLTVLWRIKAQFSTSHTWGAQVRRGHGTVPAQRIAIPVVVPHA